MACLHKVSAHKAACLAMTAFGACATSCMALLSHGDVWSAMAAQNATAQARHSLPLSTRAKHSRRVGHYARQRATAAMRAIHTQLARAVCATIKGALTLTQQTASAACSKHMATLVGTHTSMAAASRGSVIIAIPRNMHLSSSSIHHQ